MICKSEKSGKSRFEMLNILKGGCPGPMPNEFKNLSDDEIEIIYQMHIAAIASSNDPKKRS
jgi:hypothetical protein